MARAICADPGYARELDCPGIGDVLLLCREVAQLKND
jgi:energy-converting hydrogenase Eha subunit B